MDHFADGFVVRQTFPSNSRSGVNDGPPRGPLGSYYGGRVVIGPMRVKGWIGAAMGMLVGVFVLVLALGYYLRSSRVRSYLERSHLEAAERLHERIRNRTARLQRLEA